MANQSEKGPEVVLSIESFATKHPSINPHLLLEHARGALGKYHSSWAKFLLYRGTSKVCPASISFEPPDPRSDATLEREDFVEKGAIVMAGIVLAEFEGKQITRVVSRGSHVDYFVGESQDDIRWIMEVGGTDEGNLRSLRSTKRRQLESSYYRCPPHRKDGFVSATRFAPQAGAALDDVPCD